MNRTDSPRHVKELRKTSKTFKGLTIYYVVSCNFIFREYSYHVIVLVDLWS